MEENNKKWVDFNIDLAPNDQNADRINELIEEVSSVNIACGVHSGSPLTMKQAVENCKFKSKVIGALIGFNNSVNDPASLSSEEIEAVVLYQLGAISAFAKAYSLNIEHVRPHGLMYELLKTNKEFALNFANSVKKFNRWFVLYGPDSEAFNHAAQETGMNIAKEFIVENEDSVSALKELIESNKMPDTIHFHTAAENVKSLMESVKEFANARPVNFNNVVSSGWVD